MILHHMQFPLWALVVLSVVGVWSALVFFYTLYLAAINLWGNRHETSNTVLAIAAPMLITMLACDFAMNMTLAALIFFDLPRELLVTARLKRYRALPDGWRKHWADEICTRGLNPFDPSKDHC